MKIKGQKIEGPNVELIIIPRGNGEDIVFKAQAILDFGEFYSLCPAPKPPRGMKPGGVMVENINDPIYKAQNLEHSERHLAWMILKSLQATEELEWQQAKLEEPDSWKFYRDELRASGFSDVEIGRIVQGVMSANGLNETRMEEARQRFYARELLKQNESGSQTDVPDSMQRGVPLNALLSDPQDSQAPGKK